MGKITDTSKRILEFVLERAVNCGNLECSLSYQQAMTTLGISDVNYFNVCMFYLYDAGFLKFISKNPDESRAVKLTAKGIEFTEA